MNSAPQSPVEYRHWWEQNTDQPYGYCWCGCGQATGVAGQTNRSRGWVKGQPVRLLPGHRAPSTNAAAEEYRRWWADNAPVPFGYCWCGCGTETPLAKQTNARSGRVAGQPVRYLRTHVGRKFPKDREPEIIRLYEEGRTMAEVAKLFGTTSTTVCSVLKRHGVPARVVEMFTPAEEAAICKEYASGASGPELAHRYGCSHKTIHKIVKQHGGEIRSNSAAEETLTTGQEAEIYRRYLAGQSPEFVAEAFGVSLDAVRLSVRRSSFQPQREIPFTIEQQAAAHRRFLGGESVEAVGRAMNMPPPVVRVILRCNGIEPDSTPPNSGPRDEAALRDRLASYLLERGMKVQTEMRTLGGGRIDVAAGDGARLQVMVEVKVADPVRGIGQLFAYRAGRHPKPTMALAIPSSGLDWAPIYEACREAGVELWLVDENGSPHKLCEAPQLTYPAGTVPSAFEDMWIAR